MRSLSVSEDGRWIALLTDDDAITVFDRSKEGNTHWTAKGVVAAKFTGNDLITADQQDRIAWRSFPDTTRQRRLNPSLSLTKRIYGYAVNPLYLVFPKPSELENTMRFALTGKDTARIEGPGMGPNGRTVKLDPWQPLYSNSAFIAVMLLFGCWYIYRQDF